MWLQNERNDRGDAVTSCLRLCARPGTGRWAPLGSRSRQRGQSVRHRGSPDCWARSVSVTSHGHQTHPLAPHLDQTLGLNTFWSPCICLSRTHPRPRPPPPSRRPRDAKKGETATPTPTRPTQCSPPPSPRGGGGARAWVLLPELGWPPWSPPPPSSLSAAQPAAAAAGAGGHGSAKPRRRAARRAQPRSWGAQGCRGEPQPGERLAASHSLVTRLWTSVPPSIQSPSKASWHCLIAGRELGIWFRIRGDPRANLGARCARIWELDT